MMRALMIALGSSALLASVGCIDGTTPNCRDAGGACGPEAAADAPVSDAPSDGADVSAPDASDASDGAADVTSDAGDTSDALADGSADAAPE